MSEAFKGWAILELMGHRRLAGFVQEVDSFGVKMCRIDIPDKEPGSVRATQFYGGSAIYCLTPSTEETVRRTASIVEVTPVQLWELPQLPARPEPSTLCVLCGLQSSDCECEISEGEPL